MKKDNNLKINLRNLEFNDIVSKNRNYKIVNYKLENINNELGLIKNIKTDYFFPTKNIINEKKIKLKGIYEYIINKETKNGNFNNNQNFIKEMKLNNNEMNINKIDIDKLKNKINKLKEQYIKETNKKEYEFKKRKKKKIENNNKDTNTNANKSDTKEKKLNIINDRNNNSINNKNNDKSNIFPKKEKQRNIGKKH